MGAMPTNVSEQVRKMNPHLFGAQQAKKKTVVESGKYADEDELHDACEKWLVAIGYTLLTAANAMAAKNPRGWYGHLSQPKGNPFMPDIFIFRAGRCLLVELKVREDYRPGQLAMIERGEWKLATSEEQFAALVITWEKTNDVV